MIPRRFLWAADFLWLSAAFRLAHDLTPWLQRVTRPGGPLRPVWIEQFSPPVGLPAPHEFRSLSESVWVFVAITLASMALMHMLGGYDPIHRQSRTRIVLAPAVAMVFALSLVALLLFVSNSERWSRLFIFAFAVAGAAGLAAYRLVLRWYRWRRLRAGYNARNMLLIGSGRALERLVTYFAAQKISPEYRLHGYLAIDAGTGLGARVPGVPNLGTVDRLGDLLIKQPVHEVIVVHGSDTGWLQDVINQCDYFQVRLRLVPEPLLLGTPRDLQLLYHSDELRLPEIVLSPPHLDSDALFLKRVVDILVSAVLLVLLAPLFALIAVAIRLSTPHLPVFYRWRVIGYKGQPFTGYKFTTMEADADRKREELLAHNEMTGPVFKIKDDPRMTRLGRVLRKYSLNEIPQLWSVLKGDMSLVGPRPAFPHELARYELWHKRKLCVRPGITCLWQVRGRNRISNFDDWVRMDLEYIDNWSLWLDLKVLVRTAWVVGKGTGS